MKKKTKNSYLCHPKISDYKQNRLWIIQQQRQNIFSRAVGEVCNKVGGIYTVLSTKAHTLQRSFKDKLIFIDPMCGPIQTLPDFIEDDVLFADWKTYTKTTENLKVKVGRWNVPGTPPVILVDFKPFFKEKDSFSSRWESFRVDSIHAYGDYDESCIFAYAVGKVIESFYHFTSWKTKKVAALFNEWMLGMGALYIKKTTPRRRNALHDTRHIYRPFHRRKQQSPVCLYGWLQRRPMAGGAEYGGETFVGKTDSLACGLLFTTVSDITARECKQLLDKAPDIVTPNGFEPNFVPSDKEYDKKRMAARRDLLNVAEKLLGCSISPDAFLVSTSGRYEYRNKGIDVFIEAMNRVRTSGRLSAKSSPSSWFRLGYAMHVQT